MVKASDQKKKKYFYINMFLLEIFSSIDEKRFIDRKPFAEQTLQSLNDLMITNKQLLKQRNSENNNRKISQNIYAKYTSRLNETKELPLKTKGLHKTTLKNRTTINNKITNKCQ